MFIALLMTAYAGFVLLALTMGRHEDQLLSRPLPPRLRRPSVAAGYVLLTLSAAIGVAGWGWGTGLTLWLGGAAISGTALAALLTYRPGWVLYAAAATPVTLLALL